MALKICAMLAALGCAALTLDALLAGDPGVEPTALQPSPQPARPCLVLGRRCLDLSDAPFAPCLASTERCKPDVDMLNLATSAPAR